MFFFDSFTMTTLLGGPMVLAGLLFVNEITRRIKWLSVAFYIAKPCCSLA